MPPPPPPDKPGSFGAAGSTDEIDPDYLYFLRYVYPEGRAYAEEIPSKDGSSPPRVVRYEKPLAAPNAKLLAASSEGGTRDASSSKEGDPSAAVEPPSGAPSPSPPAGPDGGTLGHAVSVEEDGLLSAKAEPAWYDCIPNIDEDYRIFLQHCRMVGDSWVFEMGNVSVTIQEAPFVGKCENDDEDEDEEDEDDGVEDVSESQRYNSLTPEENDDVEEEKPMVVRTKCPVVKVKEEVEDTVKSEEIDKNKGMHTTGSDLQVVSVMEYEMNEEVNEEDREASSRQGHSTMPLSASELDGVIWPAHIAERPNSYFKRKLMKVLTKPFNREEYDNLFAMATDRTPIIKERRTRRRVMYYPWKHEMGKSYFDHYPDLAEEVEGESSYPNRLALLRGFFFWLENVGHEHEEQFRPWRADHKGYRVLYS